jgi:hypothetical protein
MKIASQQAQQEIRSTLVRTPVRFPLGRLPSMRLPVKVCGIPHLAKNERDVGHPGFCGHARV